MKLLTKALEKKLPLIGSTDGVPNSQKKIVCKFFTPDANWTWYVLEGQPLVNGDYEFFGLVDGLELEFGYFLLSQLKEVRGQFGLPIERDYSFDDGDHLLTEYTAIADGNDSGDWYDADGSCNPSGAYDAGGHYFAERAVNQAGV